jgi:hypothetical protein
VSGAKSGVEAFEGALLRQAAGPPFGEGAIPSREGSVEVRVPLSGDESRVRGIQAEAHRVLACG